MPHKKQYIEKILKEHGGVPHINCKFCIACKRRCCDICGCGLMPCDVSDMSINGIRKMLDTGKYSIMFTYIVQKDGIFPLPLLGSREVGAGKVNASLFRKKCALQTENGCIFSEKERPTQALLYIPRPDGKCYSLISPDEVLNQWKPYCGILEYIVIMETGKTSKVLFDEECRKAAERIKRKTENVKRNPTIVLTPEERDVLQILKYTQYKDVILTALYRVVFG